MRNAILIFITLLSIGMEAQFDSIQTTDGIRHYKIHFPPSYDASEAYPMIIGFHGGFGNAEQFEDQSLLSEKADEADFIAVYPQGLGFPLLPNLRYWNAGICCGYPNTNDIDDVAFISNMIDTIALEHNIDLNRVYCTGMSNGGFMSYRMACERADKIAAIAPVAGGMVTEVCDPSQGVPIIHFHSFLDDNIPYNGGVGNGASTHYNPPLDSVFNVWAGHNECTVFNDTIYEGDDFTHVRWSDCECNQIIDYYISTDGGHSWPSGTKVLGDPVSQVINANDLMWEFFQLHTLDCEGDFIEENDDFQFEIYPNPSSGQLSFKKPISNDFTLKIYDLQGSLCYLSSYFVDVYNLELEHLKMGTYLVVFQTQDKVDVKRWVLNREY